MRDFVAEILQALRELWLWLLFRGRVQAVRVNEVPDSLKRRRLYVLGGDSPWSAAMLCPCGCGKVIHLSLLPTDSPTWTISFNGAGLPTLAPSIWRTEGCRAHFFLRQGVIVWCKEGLRR